ncbi:phage holin family protein [Escherichia coli]
MESNLPGVLNVVLCSVIVSGLLFYRRQGTTYKPLVSLLAWLMMVVWSFIPFCFLFGYFPQSGWPEVVVNLVFCLLVIRARGNVSKILSFRG